MERFKESDTWLKAKNSAMRALLILLWAESWQQKPCGSLPSDDDMIATLLGMDPEEFTERRSVLMRGWWLAEDGRLYHDVVIDRVLAMIEKRTKDAKRAARCRTPSGAESNVTRDSRVTHADVGSESPERSPPSTKHQAPEPRTGEDKQPKAARKRAAASQLVSVEAMVADGVDAQHAADWLAVRKAKGLPLTPTAWAETKAEAVKAGMTTAQAVREAAAHGWAGFRAKWLAEQDHTRRDQPASRAPPDSASRNAEAKRLLGIQDNTETIDA